MRDNNYNWRKSIIDALANKDTVAIEGKIWHVWRVHKRRIYAAEDAGDIRQFGECNARLIQRKIPGREGLW